jgi:hypothetical protein
MKNYRTRDEGNDEGRYADCSFTIQMVEGTSQGFNIPCFTGDLEFFATASPEHEHNRWVLTTNKSIALMPYPPVSNPADWAYEVDIERDGHEEWHEHLSRKTWFSGKIKEDFRSLMDCLRAVGYMDLAPFCKWTRRK